MFRFCKWWLQGVCAGIISRSRVCVIQELQRLLGPGTTAATAGTFSHGSASSALADSASSDCSHCAPSQLPPVTCPATLVGLNLLQPDRTRLCLDCISVFSLCAQLGQGFTVTQAFIAAKSAVCTQKIKLTLSTDPFQSDHYKSFSR